MAYNGDFIVYDVEGHDDLLGFRHCSIQATSDYLKRQHPYLVKYPNVQLTFKVMWNHNDGSPAKEVVLAQDVWNKAVYSNKTLKRIKVTVTATASAPIKVLPLKSSARRYTNTKNQGGSRTRIPLPPRDVSSVPNVDEDSDDDTLPAPSRVNKESALRSIVKAPSISSSSTRSAVTTSTSAPRSLKRQRSVDADENETSRSGYRSLGAMQSFAYSRKRWVPISGSPPSMPIAFSNKQAKH